MSVSDLSEAQPDINVGTPGTQQARETKQIDKALLKFRNSEQGKALVSWALDQYRKTKSAREREELQWKKNLAMYNGKQYLQVTRAGRFQGQLVELPKDNNKKRRTVNRTAPIVRTEISRLVSQKPSVSVLPASSDDQDMFAALAGEQVWESHSARRSFITVETSCAFWVSVTGNGFIKTYWDDSAYDRDADVLGDVIYEAISPFNLSVPDLREEDIEKQPFVINFYTKPVDWLRMFYAEELKGIELTPSALAANEILESTYLNISESTKTQPDSCMVYEFWVKPGGSKLLPNGGYFVLVDKTIVAYSDQGIPYRHGEYPFAHAGNIITGKFYRRSVLDDTNELNEDYNSWRTQLNEARTVMAHPQILAQKGSVSAARWSNQTGLMIEYKLGFAKPEPIPLATMPSYVLQEGNNILADIEDISGQHQVSKGNVPAGVTAATAISYLQEKDDDFLVPAYQSFEQLCEKVARQTLTLCVQFWDVPRLVKVAGDDNEFDVQQLSGSDIKNGTDIRVEAGSALPTSKAARQQFIIDLMNMQAVPMEKGLELLDIGGAPKLMDQLNVDKRQAQRENVRMKGLSAEEIMANQQLYAMQPMMDQQSQQPLSIPPVVSVNEFDNHAVHIETHNNFRKSQAYLFLDPAVKQEFEKHVKLHEAMMQTQRLQNALASIPSDGSAPGVSGLIDPTTGMPSGQVTDGSGPGIPSNTQFGTQENGGVQSGIGGQ